LYENVEYWGSKIYDESSSAIKVLEMLLDTVYYACIIRVACLFCTPDFIQTCIITDVFNLNLCLLNDVLVDAAVFLLVLSVSEFKMLCFKSCI